MAISLDHHVGAGEQRWWQGQTERLGRFKVDREFIPGWLLYRQLPRLRPADDLVNVSSRLPPHRHQIRPEACEPSESHGFSECMARRQMMSESEIGNLLPIAVGEQPGNDDQRPG